MRRWASCVGDVDVVDEVTAFLSFFVSMFDRCRCRRCGRCSSRKDTSGCCCCCCCLIQLRSILFLSSYSLAVLPGVQSTSLTATVRTVVVVPSQTIHPNPRLSPVNHYIGRSTIHLGGRGEGESFIFCLVFVAVYRRVSYSLVCLFVCFCLDCHFDSV